MALVRLCSAPSPAIFCADNTKRDEMQIIAAKPGAPGSQFEPGVFDFAVLFALIIAKHPTVIPPACRRQERSKPTLSPLLRSCEGVGLRSFPAVAGLPAVAGRGISPRFFPLPRQRRPNRFKSCLMGTRVTSSASEYPIEGTLRHFPNSAIAFRRAYDLISRPSVRSLDRSGICAS